MTKTSGSYLRHERLLLSLVVVLLCGSSLVTSLNDMFTAVVDVQRAVEDEATSAELLRQYVQQEKQRIEHLERLADDWENHSRRVKSDIQNHVYHPVNFYLLAKHFSVTWQRNVEKYITPAHTQDFLSELISTTSNYPNRNAFDMSVGALFRLQDVYSLSTETISTGQIGNLNSSPHLSADDCFHLGRVAYEHEDYYHAVMWFMEALRIDASETDKTTSRPVLLDYLAFSTYKQGNVRHAFNLTLEWLQLEPDHERAQNNLKYFRDMILEEEEKLRKDRQVVVTSHQVSNPRILDSFRNNPEFDAYERLCRGESPAALVDAERPSDHLTCQYRRHVPMFYIRPLKEELVNLEPRIVVYHDILTDSEIAVMQNLSIPKLHRSGVFALKNSGDERSPGFTEYRTSKSAWLNDDEHPTLQRVSRKAEALSNLTLPSAEDFQVLNYGIGGHYEPHYDFSRGSEVSQFREDQGNRIATAVFYMNDVEYGGYTVFNVLGIGVPATKGSCLLWYNLLTNGEGDYRTRHAGCPVLVGTKWIANKWFHYGGQEFARPCSLQSNVESE